MARPKLNELMGKAGAHASRGELGLHHLEELLGEKMPKLDYTPIGRFRLHNALRQRFGDNYRHLPGIDNIMKEFDDHAAFNVKLQEMKMIKPRKK